jgi:hypothetical protein
MYPYPWATTSAELENAPRVVRQGNRQTSPSELELLPEIESQIQSEAVPIWRISQDQIVFRVSRLNLTLIPSPDKSASRLGFVDVGHIPRSPFHGTWATSLELRYI